MKVKINNNAVDYARELIEHNKLEKDEKDNWSEHAPSTDDQNNFIEKKGMEEYSKWFLGINSEEDKDNKGRYEFPYGDFNKVHRGAVIAAKVRAGQYKHQEIEDAADELLKMIDT